ncbi:MAG: hypothetical protein KAT65_17630 [Methanophagales archaeon]|nr:hypothetical protein [Methanophagales archaeon]
MKKDVDSAKRVAKEILEILESHNRGYVISENDYKMLKTKYESILKEIDRERTTKVNEKIDFKKIPVNAIRDIIKHKWIIVIGIATWWVVILSLFLVDNLTTIDMRIAAIVSIFGIPAIFGILYSPYIGASVGFLSFLPLSLAAIPEGESVIFFVILSMMILAGIMPKILPKIFAHPIFTNRPNLGSWFKGIIYLIGGVIVILIVDILKGVIASLIGNILTSYFSPILKYLIYLL